MGLRDWFKSKQEEIVETARTPYTEKDVIKFDESTPKRTFRTATMDVFLEKHPEFKAEGKSNLQLVPIDGDELRMQLYGLYKGDKILYNGIEAEITKDERPRITFEMGYHRHNSLENANYPEFARKINYAQMYLGDFSTGDKIRDDIFEYTYKENIAGFEAKCVEKNKPLKDVFVPEIIAGNPINSLKECFKDCKNVASVVRVPTSADLEFCFEGSGIRELPRNLHLSIDSNYALFGALNFVKDAQHFRELYNQNKELFGTERYEFHEWASTPYDYDVKAGCAMYYIEKAEDKLKGLNELKQELQDYIDGKATRIQGFGQVEFIENYEKITVNRLQMNDKWYVFNPTECSFTFYSNLMSTQHRNAQLFPDSSFREDEVAAQKALESIMKSIGERIEKQEKDIEYKINKLNERIASEHELCDKAQEGLDYKAPAEIKIQEPKIHELETNDEER